MRRGGLVGEGSWTVVLDRSAAEMVFDTLKELMLSLKTWEIFCLLLGMWSIVLESVGGFFVLGKGVGG